MIFAPDNPSATVDVPIENSVSEPGPSLRFVWHTVVLIAYFVLIAFLTRHAPPQNPRAFRSSTQIVSLVFQWTLWYVAYRGIRASGLSYSEVVGRRWPSRLVFWNDCKDGLVLFFVVFAVTLFLARLSPFTMRHVSPPRTAFQFFLTLLVAVSAGYTEEVIYRGLLLTQFHLLTRNLATAVFFQAFLFATAHGGYQSFTQFAKHFVSGALFAHFAIRRKSLWPSILGHSLIDVFAFTARFLRG